MCGCVGVCECVTGNKDKGVREGGAGTVSNLRRGAEAAFSALEELGKGKGRDGEDNEGLGEEEDNEGLYEEDNEGIDDETAAHDAVDALGDTVNK